MQGDCFGPMQPTLPRAPRPLAEKIRVWPCSWRRVSYLLKNKWIALVDGPGHPRTPSHGAHVLRTSPTTRGNRRPTGSFAQAAAIMATDGTLLRVGVKSVRLTWCAVLFRWKPRWLHVHRGCENCWRPALGLERAASAHPQTTDPGWLQPFDSEMPMTAEWPTAVIASGPSMQASLTPQSCRRGCFFKRPHAKQVLHEVYLYLFFFLNAPRNSF